MYHSWFSNWWVLIINILSVFPFYSKNKSIYSTAESFSLCIFLLLTGFFFREVFSLQKNGVKNNRAFLYPQWHPHSLLYLLTICIHVIPLLQPMSQYWYNNIKWMWIVYIRIQYLCCVAVLRVLTNVYCHVSIITISSRITALS